MDTNDNSPSSLLPGDLATKVEAAVGARIVEVKPRGGGGASRDGAELTFRYADGREQRAYMNYDIRKGGAGDDASHLREAAVLRALSGPLADSGVRVAPLITSIADSRVLVSGFTPGEGSFHLVKDPEQKRALGRDFMAQLAALHRIDLKRTPIEAFGPLQPASVLVRETLQAMRARTDRQGQDPLVLLTLDWLERNVPPDPEQSGIVHGDAGPGNFLYSGGEVVAVVDWELVHLGDPMADLAMMCLRNLLQPFIPMPEAFAAYEAAGGAKVDLAKVRFYRLYFQARFAGGTARFSDPNTPPPPVIGMSLVYSTMHRRVMIEALAEASGVALEPISLPDAPEGPRHHTFQVALDDLKDFIVPRVADQQASAKAKGLARLVKWWRDCERYGPAFDGMEIGEISKALGKPFAAVAEARAGLCAAIDARAIDDPTAVRLCHAIATRETALLADSMGALSSTHFAPLA
jgi:aminoglycoside phosphotransferase (APT) family kinase protein